MSTPRQATEMAAEEALLRLSRECSTACGWLRNSARQLNNSARKGLLLDIANAFERFHQEHERERERLGAKPADKSSFRGAVSQIAASLVTQFARGHDETLLKACETSVEQVLKDFNNTLELHIEPNTREILVKQRHELEGLLANLHAASSAAELDRP